MYRQQTARVPVIVAETGLRSVVAGNGLPGWVSGNPANLAASASVTCVFDLGADWDQYTELQVSVKCHLPSSGFTKVNVVGSDTPALSGSGVRRCRSSQDSAVGGTLYESVSSAVAALQYNVRPWGRYVSVLLTNGDAVNAAGALSAVAIAAYPG